MTSTTTKTQIKNALVKAGLLCEKTRVQGNAAAFSLYTYREDVRDFLVGAGYTVRECIGGECWSVIGSGGWARVSPATRELIWNNMD